MNEAANWYRCYCWRDDDHMVGGYGLSKRKNLYRTDHVPYYDSRLCRLNNPMGEEKIYDLAKRRQNIKDVYRTSWWGVPPTYDDLSLSEDQWGDNQWKHHKNGKKNDNERVK